MLIFLKIIYASFRRLKKASMAYLLVLISSTGIASAASVPDASKPGGSQAGREFVMPSPPSERMPLPRLKTEKPRDMQNALTRIQVKEIRLQGVIDRPELDISAEKLLKFVETLRQKKLKLDYSSKDTDVDNDEESKLLKKIEKLMAEADDEDEQRVLKKFVRRFRGAEKTTETLTLQQLQEIAASVAQYYRTRGLFLAQVFIPPQTVADGIIQIRVLEGILGNVAIEKNGHYGKQYLLLPFRSLLGLPITRQGIEKAMFLLNDYPGLKTFAVFNPGTNMGEADLLISVLEEKRVGATIHVDNYGSEYTGENRLRIDAHINSLFGGIDKLALTLSKTYSPANGAYNALLYERSAFGPQNTFGFGMNRNTYNLGGSLSSLNIDGETSELKTYWRHAFQRSRLLNSYGLFQFSRKSSMLNVEQGTGRQDDLSVASLEVGFNWTGTTRKNTASGWLRFSRGFDSLLGAMVATNDPTETTASRRGGSGYYAAGEFEKTNIDYQHWTNLSQNHTVHFSFNAQNSGDLLTSIEQMPIGGPNSVRAYATSEYLRDKGYFTSLEWLIRAPGFSDWHAFGNKRWGEVFQVAIFADYAEGWLNDPLVSDTEYVSLSGVGVGLRFNYKTISARFEFASPLSEEEPTNNRDPQYYLEMNYGF